MNRIVYQLKAERIRLSGTAFYKLHVGIPLIGIVFLTGYLAISSYEDAVLTGFYYQILGLIYLIIIRTM